MSALDYGRVARNRLRSAMIFRIAAGAFCVVAVVAAVKLAAVVGEHAPSPEIARWAKVLGWTVVGAIYTWLHVGSALSQAESWEAKAKWEPERRAHNERMEQHYLLMNKQYGRHYEKIDEGWWSEDAAMLAQYAGLVARWKPGGDLYREPAHIMRAPMATDREQ